jgi:hypothetical protein
MCLLLSSNWSLLENATVELGDELGEDVDWVRLYRILQAEQTALLSNRRYLIKISSCFCRGYDIWRVVNAV